MPLNRSAAAAGALAAALLLPAVRPAVAAGASSTEEMLSGEVVSSTSRWARGRSAIVTESVLRTPSGRQVTLRQLGGSVDGIGMVVLHSTAVLRAGDRVIARVAVARDLAGRTSRSVRALYQQGGAGGGLVPFVRTQATETREPLAWRSGCAKISFDEAGTSHIEGDLEFQEMERVLIRWRYDVQSCSYFDLRYEGRDTGEVGLDGLNLVIFRDERWCRPATDEEPEDCYDPNAAGLTTLFFIDDEASSRNGTLLDADVELNAVNFSVAVDHQTASPGNCESDLANTFTHEIGHLMGLDHTCWSGVGIRLDNHQGEPLPDCRLNPNLPAAVRDATMFNFQDCGETKKASPAPDDILGVCDIYPLEENPRECLAAELEPGATCSVSTRGSTPAALLVAVAFLLARRRRRAS